MAISWREWQETCYETYLRLQQEDFLITATPGAGKTRLALRIAKELVNTGQVERLVVLTPTSHLKLQWAEEAEPEPFALPLDVNWGEHRGFEGPNYKGIALTYAQIGQRGNAALHHNLCSRRRTAVIFDEIHHAGDQLSWGTAIEEAFNHPTTIRIALSGTPFRSDNRRIPFVRFVDGNAEPDFAYTYGMAVRQGVCRPVLFQGVNGRIEFMRRGELVSTSFDDTDLDEVGASLRLRTALNPGHSWLRNVLQQANEELTRIRSEEQRDAGGLVIAMDRGHALAIAGLLQDIAGQRPAVAISDAPEDMQEASAQIESFKRNRRPWIVAVKMVSEGVDIPRLRVGVYATNVVTRMFFRQAVGRFVRMQEALEEQTSHLFIPEDDRIVEFALSMKNEQEAAYNELWQDMQKERGQESPDSGDRLPPLDYMSVDAQDEAGDFVFNEDKYPPEEWESARQRCIEFGMIPAPVTILAIAKSQRVFNNGGVRSATTSTSPAVATPTHRRMKSLRDYQSYLARRFALQIGVEYKAVFSDLARRFGGLTATATEEQLQRRIAWLRGQLGEDEKPNE